MLPRIDSFCAWKPPLCHKDTERKTENVLIRGLGCLELCLYGIRESWPQQHAVNFGPLSGSAELCLMLVNCLSAGAPMPSFSSPPSTSMAGKLATAVSNSWSAQRRLAEEEPQPILLLYTLRTENYKWWTRVEIKVDVSCRVVMECLR